MNSAPWSLVRITGMSRMKTIEYKRNILVPYDSFFPPPSQVGSHSSSYSDTIITGRYELRSGRNSVDSYMICINAG
jgi:hypothetical protein